MLLIDVFNKTLNGESVTTSDIEEDNIQEQVTELMALIYGNKALHSIQLYEYNDETVQELLRSKDETVRVSSAITLLSRKFPEYKLSEKF